MRSTDSLQNELERKFDRVDGNGDGSVSFAEFKGLMVELGDRSTDGALLTSFARIDSNLDGCISFDELSAWLRRSARGLVLSSARSTANAAQG
jgi:Ca2+-binding EF-hand superfamily protein